MRRQPESGGIPAGSSRSARLDPFALPIRFPAGDAGADERVRWVELHRERVVVRRAVRGIRMAVNVPVASFIGVALRLASPGWGGRRSTSISLEHRDPGLCVSLPAADGDDAIAEWQLWARILGLPPLVVEPDGTLREPFLRLGAVRIAAVAARRRRRNAVSSRRPRLPLRRPAARIREPRLHRGEREIIARN